MRSARLRSGQRRPADPRSAAAQAQVGRDRAVAPMLGPAGGRAAVEVVGDRRIGARGEQRAHGLHAPVLGREVERGDALAVLGAAEGRLPARIRAELDQPLDRLDVALGGRPDQGGAAVRVGVDIRAELDQRCRGRPHDRSWPPTRAPRRGSPAGRRRAPTAGSRVCGR